VGRSVVVEVGLFGRVGPEVWTFQGDRSFALRLEGGVAFLGQSSLHSDRVLVVLWTSPWGHGSGLGHGEQTQGPLFLGVAYSLHLQLLLL